eukprot:EG_transcript_23904
MHMAAGSPGRAALRIAVRPYRPADEAAVHCIFGAGMMSIVTPLWRESFWNCPLLPVLSCAPPAAMLYATRSVAHVLKWPLCLASAIALPSLLWLWVHSMLRRYVRKSLTEDLADIPAFYSAAGAGPGSMFWVACAEADGMEPVVVGHVALERKTAEVAELRRMSVRADYQGCGVAKQLCQTLLDHAKRSGFETVILTTSNGQRPAIALYRRSGWAEVKVTPGMLGLFSIHHFAYRLAEAPGADPSAAARTEV